MTTLDSQIAFATAWLSEVARKVPHGEVGVRFILHSGQVTRLEQTVIKKTQTAAQAAEGGFSDA